MVAESTKMYARIEQFGIDKSLNTFIEESGIAEAYIREYYRRKGIKLGWVRKHLADYEGSKAYDLKDNFGVRWEVKCDRRAHSDQIRDGCLVWATGNVYVELKALLESQADMYLIFQPKGCCIAKNSLLAAVEGRTALRGGDMLKSLGVPLTAEELEEVAEQVIVL